jgi:hypothetical protein
MTMNTVILNSSGTILNTDTITAVANALPHLGHRTTLAEDFTLRSYFRMLEVYPLLAELNSFFPDFIKQFHDSPKTDAPYAPIEHLVFRKTVEMIGFPGKPRLEIYNALQGIAGDIPSDIKAVSLRSLLDMPVTLGKLRHVVFGDTMDVFEFDTVYTLFEFIDGIAWELSFHNAPIQCELRR